MVKTFFKAVTAVTIPSGISGGGWNAERTYAEVPIGENIIVSTNQLPDNSVNDHCIQIQCSGEQFTQSFETLGRLIACGAIVQVTE